MSFQSSIDCMKPGLEDATILISEYKKNIRCLIKEQFKLIIIYTSSIRDHMTD